MRCHTVGPAGRLGNRGVGPAGRLNATVATHLDPSGSHNFISLNNISNSVRRLMDDYTWELTSQPQTPDARHRGFRHRGFRTCFWRSTLTWSVPSHLPQWVGVSLSSYLYSTWQQLTHDVPYLYHRCPHELHRRALLWPQHHAADDV